MNLKRTIEAGALTFASCSLMLAVFSPFLRSQNEEYTAQTTLLVCDTIAAVAGEQTEQIKVEPPLKRKRIYVPYVEII